MAAWARGVVINGTISAVTTGLLLGFIGVQPALVFGFIAFLGEFVPMVGPVLTSIPALFVALSMGVDKFGLALLVVLFVQQVETNILVPFILGKSMELNPVSILFFGDEFSLRPDRSSSRRSGSSARQNRHRGILFATPFAQ